MGLVAGGSGLGEGFFIGLSADVGTQDLGFIVPLKRVANMLPKERQSLFFSATMPKAIADLGKQFISNPVRVEVAPQATTAERVEQRVTHLNQGEKQALLSLTLRAGLAEDGKIERALVFTRTKHEIGRAHV